MRMMVYDPSGNWGKEGNGTTGWAEFNDGELEAFGVVKAEDFASPERYWAAVVRNMLGSDADLVVCESYNLFGHKAKEQSGSSLDTPQLIGHMRMVCYEKGIRWLFQNPSDKQVVTDDILTRQGVFTKKGNIYYCQGDKTIIHSRDAIRHGIFFYRHGKGREYREARLWLPTLRKDV